MDISDDGLEQDSRMQNLLIHFENVIHDIKTPLSIIYLTAKALEPAENLTKAQKKQLNTVSKYCLQIIKLLDDTNDYDKIVSGRFVPKLVNYDIVALLDNFVTNARPLANRKDIQIQLNSGLSECILATDRDFVERILLNILSNAIKFSPRGSLIVITLREEKGSIVIDLADQGIGIDPERLKYVFDRYETNHGVVNASGSGIGLSLVKEMTDSLGGTVSVRLGGDGKGTVFSIALPCNKNYDQTPIELNSVSLSFSDMVQTVLFEEYNEAEEAEDIK